MPPRPELPNTRNAAPPALYLIAGPNGARKTTTALTLLPDALKLFEFVNADEIARGLSPLNQSSVDELAARLMIERISLLIAQRKSFAFESTMAGSSWLRRVQDARNAGYETHLLFLYVESVQVSIKRVRHRVRQGGHDMPDGVIGRRYQRGLSNLVKYYPTAFDSVLICDN